MGWAVGFDSRWNRDIGYGVPAICDRPACGADIDRGLSYVCGGAPYGGEHGCGLFFCAEDLLMSEHGQVCRRCLAGEPPFDPTPDTAAWLRWKLTDKSWADWRRLHTSQVAQAREALALAGERMPR